MGIPKSEFLKMKFVEVLYRLYGLRQQRLYELNQTRVSIFHQWRGQGVKVGNMPLQYLWQVFEIPELDGDVRKSIKFTTARPATEEEMEMVKRLNNGDKN